MTKKKHQPKKHTFKHAAPVAAPVAGNTTAAPKAATTSGRPVVVADTRDFSYVTHDLKRVSIFAASLITLELGLWLAMDYTPLGNIVYGLIKL
jgi:hypothetical protein